MKLTLAEQQAIYSFLSERFEDFVKDSEFYLSEEECESLIDRMGEE